MKRLTTAELTPGMMIGVKVQSIDNQLVLPAGTILTAHLITKLNMYGIITVYIVDTTEDSIRSEDIIKSEEFQSFKKNYDAETENFQFEINKVVEKNTPLDTKALLGSCFQLIDNAQGRYGVIQMLQNIKEYDDATYTHSINVGLICNVLANWLKWDKEDVEVATACGMLHDVGKLQVSRSIIKKPGKLTTEEYESVKSHPELGYNLLVSQGANPCVCYSALRHHERCDGSGYPFRLSHDEIDKYSKLVAIADVYDAITSTRVYRGAMCPFEALRIMEEEGLQKYEVEYVIPFLQNVAHTYIRNRCLLSDGREGDIIYINLDKLSRPIVKCEDKYVNLMEHTKLTIAKLL